MPALDVLDCGIDSDGRAKPGKLSPNHAIRAGETRDSPDRCRVKHRVRGDAQVTEDLVQAVRAHRAQLRGLADIRAEHVSQAGPKPVER